MPTPEKFPVLLSHRPSKRDALLILGITRSVPWRLVEPLRAHVSYVHNQTLERLADRGGLSPGELHGNAHGLRFGQFLRDNDPVVVEWFKAWIKT